MVTCSQVGNILLIKMRLLGKKELYSFKQRHADARKQVEAWEAEVKDADWRSPHDMKRQYPTADPLGNLNTIFNICGNKYRLWVLISYEEQVVLVKKIGTHEEYDKWQIK